MPAAAIRLLSLSFPETRKRRERSRSARRREDGEMWPFENFVEHVAQLPGTGESDLDRLVNDARNLQGRPDFDDDLSIMRIVFH
jgi:hypothetical protein